MKRDQMLLFAGIGSARYSHEAVLPAVEASTCGFAPHDSAGMMPGQRRLVAVLAADVVGYTRLMEAAEADTHARVMRLQSEVVDPQIATHGGRIVKHTGDGFWVTFDSAVEAAQCALAIQAEACRRAGQDPPARRILFRMGLNVADAIIEAHDIFGEGVNIAARLQSHAEPGGLVMSGAVAEQVSGRLGGTLVSLGELFLKNLSRPVRAYSILAEERHAKGQWGGHLEGHALALATDRPSIAVLPFRQGRASRDEAYFAEGIIEGIIHVLAGLPDLFVISQGSTLVYAGPAVDPRRVGRELGVRYVLQGSVRRWSDRLRILTQLTDADSGTVIRTGQHDGDAEDLFAVQDRISGEVVAAIAPQVREHELLRAMRKHPDNLTAYDLVLQALDRLHRLDQESFARARGLLQQAMAADVGFAPVYSYAALWHILRAVQGWSPDPAADYAEAGRLSAGAVECDRNDPLALAMRGHMLAWAKDYEGSMRMFDRAVSAGPSSPLAWSFSSLTCGYLGNGTVAVQRAEHALRLAPHDPFGFLYESFLSQAHYLNGDIEAALHWSSRSTAENPRHAPSLRVLIASLVYVGRVAEACAVAQRLLTIEPNFRLAAFAGRTPLPEAIRSLFIERLRVAGLPD